VFASSSEWPNRLRRHVDPFIASRGNMPVGVSETQTCSGCGPDMSGQPLLNSDIGPDMSGLTGVFGGMIDI
jgi:hypothetical protein